MTTPPLKKVCLTEPNLFNTQIRNDHCYLTTLPSELLVVILSFLPVREKLHVRLTCHRLYALLTDSIFWKNVVWRDYFPPREEKALKSALQLGAASLTMLSIFSCGTIALSRFKNALASCTQLQSVVLIGFTVSRQQITALLSSTSSTRTLEVEVLEKDSNPIIEVLAQSQVVSVVLHICQTPNITLLTKTWSVSGYSPADMKICVQYNSGTSIAYFQFALVNILTGLPPCSHKARLAVGYSSIHTYIRPATMQPFCEIFNKKSSFEFSVLGCKELGLSTSYMLSLARPSIVSEQYTAAYVQSTCRTFLDQTVPQGTSFLENITELCLANLHELSSHHLTLIAINCSHLVRLNIQKCTKSLSDLSGLSSIASHCHNLQGISFDCIHYCEVECVVRLWEILAKLKHLSHLCFCYCMVSSCKTLSQQHHVTNSVTPHVQSRVSRIISQKSDVAALQAFIRKLSTVDTLELTCHVPGVQDDRTTFQILSCFRSLQYLRLESSPHKVDVLNEIFPSLRLSSIHINTGARHPLNMPSNPACYQNLQKVAIIAHLFPQFVVINQSIASALTSAKKLTHIYIAASFNTPDAITTLICESPCLIEFTLTGMVECASLTRKTVKRFEKSVKTELTKRKIRHQVVLYVQMWPVSVSQIMNKAMCLTELSSLWMSKDLL